MRHLTRAEVTALLRCSILFRSLDEQELDSLASRAPPAEFIAGQLVVRRADHGIRHVQPHLLCSAAAGVQGVDGS